MTSSDARIDAKRGSQRANDHCPGDDLLAEAQRLTGTTEKTALVRQALTALIERESARRLARLGGSDPSLGDISRRRTASS
jgi:Arc/MetJ family transcription regulator